MNDQEYSVDTLPHDLALGTLASGVPPCLSLYQPTHRKHPDNQQDPIRFRNLVKTLEASLLQGHSSEETAALLSPFHTLANDHAFWTHTRDGLAVLGDRDGIRVYKLQRPVKELAVVADSFHVKPLLRLLQSADRYQILGINRHAIRLFEGNRYALDEIDPAPQVPRTLTDALGDQLTEPHSTVASYGGGGASPSAMHHGHGGKEEEVDSDTERFFRAVDRAIFTHYSKPSGLPLLLATLPEHRGLFHAVSHNSQLATNGIDIHPDAITLEELRLRAWEVLEPAYLARLDAQASSFEGARATGMGDDDLSTIANAIADGRVATLLVEADRIIPGRVDHATGAVTFADMASPDVDDVLDDLAEQTMKKGGRVVVTPLNRMPTDTGAAATFRF